MINEINSRVESEIEVKAYLQNLKYVLKNGANRTGNNICNVISFCRKTIYIKYFSL